MFGTIELSIKKMLKITSSHHPVCHFVYMADNMIKKWNVAWVTCRLSQIVNSVYLNDLSLLKINKLGNFPL